MDAVGDPQWIGVLRNLSTGHVGDNRFISRYAYIALPVGLSLDINVNHNQAKRPTGPNGAITEGFFRNQGYGSWEINLASFLVDLNTNQWGVDQYNYTFADTTLPSTANAFQDALSLVRFRVGGDYNTGQASAEALFGQAATNFIYDRLDSYGNGPAQLATNFFQTINLDVGPLGYDTINQSWPGSPPTNKFFTPWDLFDPKKTSPQFVKRLNDAGTNASPYDATTFYRLLSQLGTDTAPLKTKNLINLNYDNLSGPAERMTNWDATAFFMEVGDRLIREYTNDYFFTITNIMIYPTNLYSVELHRLLQMTANIYDATRNDVGMYPDLPTVFRPLFVADGNNIFIRGFREETNTSVLDLPMLDLNYSSNRNEFYAGKTDVMFWGIPLIIGARKGYPSFNEFSVQSIIQVTRKLAFVRPATNQPVNQTNVMWVLGISNSVGAACWNSYNFAFPRALEMRATNFMMPILTNEMGYPTLPGMPNPPLIVSSLKPTVIPPNDWRQKTYDTSDPGYWKQYRFPVFTNLVFLPDSIFFSVNNTFSNINVVPKTGFDPTFGFPTPQWGLKVVNNFFYCLVDPVSNRIVDYVNLNGLDSHVDITKEMIMDNTITGEPGGASRFWVTNRVSPGAPPQGILDQIQVCLGNITATPAVWRNYSDLVAQRDTDKSQPTFKVFMSQASLKPGSMLVQQSPFSPTRKIIVSTLWQVNDPLVHYRTEDLLDPRGTTNKVLPLIVGQVVTNSNLGRWNKNYKPWGGNRNPNKDQNNYDIQDLTDFDLRVKDSLVKQSDDWDFPHTKFANIGWLGRVHRGTPWQTIYLKSDVVSWETWESWSHSRIGRLSHPTNDWRLVDMFTVAPHPEATRGLMSINQTNLAAWSATLGGILVLSNSLPDGLLTSFSNFPPAFADVDIKPNTDQLYNLYNAITVWRTNQALGQFARLSDLLAIPELTVRSPFLNFNSAVQHDRGISDAAYECLPQKLLSLLRVGDTRYVIYSWGQSLRPARNSIQVQYAPTDPRFQLCTNYVVAGEVLTRTVLRIENVSKVSGQVRPRAIIESYNVLPPE
jgi:hypothetical protein